MKQHKDTDDGGERDWSPPNHGDFFAGITTIKIVQPTTALASTTPGSQLDLCGSALFYANRGWAVFPCVPAKYDGEGGKSPRIKDWQNLATIDREQIIDWWTRMPSSNVGVICGARSGLLIVDVDCKPDRNIDGWISLAALEAVHGSLPAGPRVRRGMSSTHVYFAFDSRLGNSVGHLPGIDVRSTGGYAVGALSFHAASRDRYQWVEGTAELPLPEMPEWLNDALSKPVAAPCKKPRSSKPRATDNVDELPRNASTYAAAALAAEIDNVSTAAEGTRNSTLNRAAFSMGTLVGARAIERDDVWSALYEAALESGLPEEEIERTLESGLHAGERQPRNLEHLKERKPRRPRLEEDDAEFEEDLK